MNLWLGVAAGLLASLCWALANIYIQRASIALGPLRALFWGQVVGAGMLLAAAPLGAHAVRAPPWGWCLVGSLASGVAYLSMFRAFASGPVSVLSPIIASWALVSCLLGVVLLGEPMPWTRGVGAVAVVLGAVGRARGAGDREVGWVGRPRDAIALSAASSLAFGVMITSQGPVASALGPALAVLAIWGGQWGLLAPWAARARLWSSWPPKEVRGALIGVGVFETGGFLALNYGLGQAHVDVVAPAAGVSPLFTLLLARLLLREPVRGAQVLLAGLVVAGVILLGLP